jgi:hypothetical protein
MNKEFTPYEIALALKELGFDEPCAGRYYTDDSTLPIFMQWTTKEGTKFNSILLPYGIDEIMLSPFISAPLYQQAFRWFREKYNLQANVCFDTEGGEPHYYFIIHIFKKKEWGYDDNISTYKTYEEAELECLKKLIEIVKNNSNDG